MASGENARLATRLRIRLSVALALVTFACFSSGLGNDFVNWDDPINILENTDFRGLSQANLEWMFTTHAGHYIPLTWLTLALDYVVWGMDPFGYHLTSLIFHALNVVLFFHVVWWLLARAFRDRSPLHDVRLLWVAATGALLHSIHPLRVESVSWVTERRDVVCGTFFLLALLAYFRKHDAVDRKVRRRWGWVSIGFFLLSLTSGRGAPPSPPSRSPAGPPPCPPAPPPGDEPPAPPGDSMLAPQAAAARRRANNPSVFS